MDTKGSVDCAALGGKARETVIDADSPPNLVDPAELWRYRELAWVLVLRDVKARYKQTVLGGAWAVLTPVTLMLIFSLIFGRLARLPSDGLPYPIFVFAGLMPWLFFANSLTASSGSLLKSASLVTKVYFPRLIIPIASIGGALVDLALSLLILFALTAYYDIGLGPEVLALPVLILAVALISLGVGAWLAALIVSYRDFTHVVPFLVQAWMFVTPVIYPISMIPQGWRWVAYLNPMSGLIEGFRSALFGTPLDLTGIAISMSVGVLLFFLGFMYFGKTQRRFADVI